MKVDALSLLNPGSTGMQSRAIKYWEQHKPLILLKDAALNHNEKDFRQKDFTLLNANTTHKYNLSDFI